MDSRTPSRLSSSQLLPMRTFLSRMALSMMQLLPMPARVRARAVRVFSVKCARAPCAVCWGSASEI
jgi:hypothetical protein